MSLQLRRLLWLSYPARFSLSYAVKLEFAGLLHAHPYRRSHSDQAKEAFACGIPAALPWIDKRCLMARHATQARAAHMSAGDSIADQDNTVAMPSRSWFSTVHIIEPNGLTDELCRCAALLHRDKEREQPLVTVSFHAILHPARPCLHPPTSELCCHRTASLSSTSASYSQLANAVCPLK